MANHRRRPQTQFTYAGGHELGGLIHYSRRYYQPTTGRWTQQDPLLQPADLGQANRYTYVSNNPMNLTDPAGLNACGINDDADRIYNCGKKRNMTRKEFCLAVSTGSFALSWVPVVNGVVWSSRAAAAVGLGCSL